MVMFYRYYYVWSLGLIWFVWVTEVMGVGKIVYSCCIEGEG